MSAPARTVDLLDAEGERDEARAEVDAAPTVRVRAATVSIKRLSKRSLELWARRFPREEHAQYERPQTRRDCLPGGCNEARPCPWVSCVWHLALDINLDTGSIKHNFPDREVWEMPETCALDIADRGGITLEEVGAVVNLTRERIRQLETHSIARMKVLGALVGLADADGEAPDATPRVHLRVVDESMTRREEAWARSAVGERLFP